MRYATDRLTVDDLRRAIRMVEESVPTACVGGNQHMVHPADCERSGIARCGACFQFVPVRGVR